MTDTQKPLRIYGPFRPYSPSGRPIVMKGILPAWVAHQPEKMKGARS